MRATRSDLPLERFPREESTIARSITQPAPSRGADQAFVTLDGRYHVLERIASGGMGEVFRAHDAVLAREVAIKVLHRSLAGDPTFVERFRREARAAAGLAHPNIVAVYDWGAVEGVYYMVMEYVRGPSVRHLLNERGRLEPAHAVEILRQSLLALGHAHHEGFVHRDMKPENLLVTRDGVVKVADFGLARAYADGRVTQVGAVTGTVQYLAPEQIRGEPADPRSDLYSLGIVAYELLTGALPFTGETAMAVAYKHLSDRVPVPSQSVGDLPSELDGFVASATDRDRELRPESADAMRMDLGEIAYQVPPASKLATLVQELPEITVEGGETTEIRMPLQTASIPRLERRQRRRRRIKRYVGAALVLALLAAAAWGTWTYAIPHVAVIPAVLGERADVVADQLTTLGFEVESRSQYSDVPEGSVARVRPIEGTELDVGSIVTIWRSLGPPPVVVPAVEGRQLQDAQDLLEADGFQVASPIRQRYHAKVPIGHVISRTPTGEKLPEGSPITLVVSKGVKPVPIPDVRGKSRERAVAALDAKGFRVVVEEIFSDEVGRDRAIGTKPGAGKELQPGVDTVVLNVSLGPERFPCPSFIGMTVEEARAKAADFGLVLAPLPVPATNGNQVISQLTQPGDEVRYGTTITVYYA